MYGRALRFISCILVLLCISTGIMAETPKESTGDEPVAAREKDYDWVLGICEPRIETGIDPSLSLLTQGFMTRVLETIINSSGDILRSAQEIEGIEQSRIDEASSRIEKTIVSKIGERDQLLFKGFTAWKYNTLLNKAIASIKEQQELLAIERSRNYVVPQTARLRFHATNEGGALLDVVKEGEESSFASKNSLDAVLSSSLREHYGSLVFSWAVYRRWDDSVVMEDEIVFTRHSRDDSADETARSILSRLTGRPLALVAIRALPEETHVEIDGRRVDISRPGLLNAGKHRLSIDREGYHPLSATFTLEGGESIVMRPLMRTLELRETAIEVHAVPLDSKGDYEISDTPVLDNVSVTLNNQFAGKTPLSLSLLTGETHILGLSLPGYESRTILYQSDGSALAQFALPVLQKDTMSVKLTRKAFYRAFGWFFLSVPLAMIATGIHDSYSEALGRTGDAVYSTGNIVSLVSMGALWTGSAVLLGNTVWHFTYYLKASDNTGVEEHSQRGK